MTATIILTAVIIAAFLLDTFVLVPKGTRRFSKSHFIDGDKTGYLTKALSLNYTKIKQGQIWRLFTQVFLHVGIGHILFNSLALLTVGCALEKTIGSGKTIIGFFVSAIFSGIIVAFCHKWEDGQGASTGIYGLIAIYITLAIKEHNILFSELHPLCVIFLGVYTVVGMCLSNIDRWEHTTGFIGGIIYGMIILYLV